MASPRLTVLLALALLSAGCLGGDAPDDATPAAADGPADAPSGDTTSGPDAGSGDAAPAPTDGPSLDAPPQWQLGDWWRVRLTDSISGETTETLRVVAGFEQDEYLVGMPRDEFSNHMMVLHIPGFGEIKKDTLGFEIHDAMWQPLQFPLEDGATWETEWQTRPVTAVATVESPTKATVEFTGQNDHFVITYDAAVGAITRIEVDGYGTFEVVDHGTGYAGTVTVPHGHDLIFFNGRAAGVLTITDVTQPAPPVETLDVDPTYDRVSFAIILGNLVGDTATGVYHEKATAPDGTTYEATFTPADGQQQFKVAFFMHDQPDGEWSFEHAAAGPGVAFTEGIAYHVYDVELPSGRILPSEGEHAHGDHGNMTAEL